ncbi:hypothetical protein ACN23B_05600 [Anabaena sp. FACHB-709]|uniref:Uncharacterized protein n=2 Tax=Nostocaceae TaxID=1162 RepID=A0A1Z4KT33_ANAVA|nr:MULTISPECIES: hypothetical protein [Nostocaceae]BAY72094.1 hypothetical protein NIES23_49180 [Trichormus variabilis NIES-23]HBW28789.1 hypothetical protein [Nostoc sp. UBA8866]MBD2171468.1 hypothetical protein [Anabaena cylindrica FACHB-318]MBD2263252.1 hypothetical protein [Anabaena sp. FACHB-709]MBD2272797.1 hypothetical protein [Nostoc sp. PCC 7120 = FACHB-418]
MTADLNKAEDRKLKIEGKKAFSSLLVWVVHDGCLGNHSRYLVSEVVTSKIFRYLQNNSFITYFLWHISLDIEGRNIKQKF